MAGISTHAPREGSDGRLPALPLPQRRRISTHAPREGSDAGPAGAGVCAGGFQPTLPARGATSWLDDEDIIKKFQPTLPARGATGISSSSSMSFTLFQPTLPARGATDGLASSLALVLQISTHAPREGSDGGAAGPLHCRAISTHAPHEGSDDSKSPTRVTIEHFNPRSPRGERPECHRQSPGAPPISTHAPREGSDASSSTSICPSTGFQPTLPARGATMGQTASVSTRPFQPTLPARGATVPGQLPRVHVAISTHAPREGSDLAFFRQRLPLYHFNPRSPRGERRPR